MEKIYFETTDKLKLCAIHEKHGHNTCLVMCHGIRGNKEEIGNFTKLVQALNHTVDTFRFDFRAHGESEGDMNQSFSFKPWQEIQTNLLPKIFIHGDSDKNVQIEQNSISTAKNSPNSELVIIPNGVHNFSRSDEKIVMQGIEATIKFLKKYI